MVRRNELIQNQVKEKEVSIKKMHRTRMELRKTGEKIAKSNT